jgi:hypothetical protein
MEDKKALRKGRLFREVTVRRLRQNQDNAVGSRQKLASIETLKAHCAMTREQAESCGENWTRCGKLVAIGGVFGFATRRLVRKIVSMEALERCGACDRAASEEIRTSVQSLATHSRAVRRTRDASFDVKSEIAEST